MGFEGMSADRHDDERSAGSQRPGGKRPRRLAKAAAVAVLILLPLVGLVSGAVIGAHRPTTIELAPGIDISASAQGGNATTLHLGSVATLKVQRHGRLPLIGDVGADMHLHEVNVVRPRQTLTELVALSEDGGAAIRDRFTTAVTWRVAEGAAVGLGVGLLASLGAVACWRALRDSTRRTVLRSGLAFVTASGLIVAGLVVAREQPSSTDDGRIASPVPAWVGDDVPLLKGAVVYGTGGAAIVAGLQTVARIKESVDDYWKRQAVELRGVAIPHLAAQGGMSWQGDPDVVPIMHITDMHGNISELKHFLPAAIRLLGVSLVFDTGDQANFGGTIPVDDYAFSKLLSAVRPGIQRGRPVQVVYVAGNHDPLHAPADVVDAVYEGPDHRPYHPFISLDEANDYTATVQGVTFVGSPDLNRTTTTDTVPSTIDGQLRNDATQGRTVAAAACRSYQNSGVRPIVGVHEMQAGYATQVGGCASLVLSGHLHVTSPAVGYVNADGSKSFAQNLGSASGDGPGNVKPEYSTPTTQGAIGYWLYNMATHQVVGHLELDLYPNRKLQLRQIALPKQQTSVEPLQDPAIAEFLQQYDPALLSPS